MEQKVDGIIILNSPCLVKAMKEFSSLRMYLKEFKFYGSRPNDLFISEVRGYKEGDKFIPDIKDMSLRDSLLDWCCNEYRDQQKYFENHSEVKGFTWAVIKSFSIPSYLFSDNIPDEIL